MLELNADYCKVITTDDAITNNSLNALLFVNIEKDVAEGLLKEMCLEVRKHKSGKPGMDHCAVIRDSKGLLWNIPRKILESVDKK